MDNARHLYKDRRGKKRNEENTTNDTEIKFVSCPPAKTLENETSASTLPKESKANFFLSNPFNSYCQILLTYISIIVDSHMPYRPLLKAQYTFINFLATFYMNEI